MQVDKRQIYTLGIVCLCSAISYSVSSKVCLVFLWFHVLTVPPWLVVIVQQDKLYVI